MLKKIVAAAAVCLFLLSGCSADYSHIEGYDEIIKARELYSALNAAHLTVTDNQSGTLTQELTFIYDSSDRLCYNYFGTDGKTEYYEYHNGSEYSYYENGEWKTLTQGDEKYRVYSKTSKLSMTDAGMIFVKPQSITASTVKETDDGKLIEVEYDASALNSSMSSQLGLVGTLKSFKVTYSIDSRGYCTQMQQTGTAELNGKESDIDYILAIDKINDISSVEKPQIKKEIKS